MHTEKFEGNSPRISQLLIRVITPVLLHGMTAVFLRMIVEQMRLHVDAAFLTTCTAVLLLPWFLRAYRSDRLRSGKTEHVRLSAAEGIRIILLALFCNLLFTIVIALVTAPFLLDNTAQETLLAASLPLQLVGIGMVVPIMEEVLFRGLVYQRLNNYNRNGYAVVLSAAIFAIYHGNLLQILFAFPMGCLLAWLYRRKQTILAPILFHITVNISSVLWNAYSAGHM